MFPIEQIESIYYGKILGVRKEYLRLNPLAAGLLIWKSQRYFKKNNCVIEGFLLPSTGAAILTGNHHRESDIYKGVQAVRLMAGRLGRSVVKASLIHRNSRESKEYLEGIGDKQDDINKYSTGRAFVLRGIGVIPILRDNPGHNFIKECRSVLKAEQLLGIFLQSTRNEQCYLNDLQPGAAYIASLFPDIPIYPLALSGPPDGPDKITILPPFSYNEKSKECGKKLTPEELTILIADTIATALPQRCQKDWQTRKEEELLRLTSPKK